MSGMLGFDDEFDEAEASIRLSINLDPENPKLHNMQGNILWAKNGFENAEAAYLRAVDLDRTYVSALTNVEKLCGQFDDDKWAQEEDNCSRLTDDADLGTGGEGTQGLCAVYAAERSIHLLIEENPSNPKTYNSLGNILRAKGDLLGAIAAYRSAISLDVNCAYTFANLGSVLEATSDFLAAE